MEREEDIGALPDKKFVSTICQTDTHTGPDSFV